MTSCRFSRWRISAILDFRGPIIGSLKSPCTTSYRSSIATMALNSLVFEKIAFLYFGDRQTNKQTDEQMDRPIVWSRSRYRERRLKTVAKSTTLTQVGCKWYNEMGLEAPCILSSAFICRLDIMPNAGCENRHFCVPKRNSLGRGTQTSDTRRPGK